MLTDDAEIHALNKKYRGVDRPTDVLSFPQQEEGTPQPAGRLLGDVAISLETAARQAILRKHSLHRETFILLAHGIIHLLGYDHETSRKDRIFTEKKTEELCRILFRE